jgi:hypothetical protein
MRNRESETSHEALRRRLQALTDRYSLSEIARRTGAPLASVSRYFRGTRVPADFCGELAVHFGLNPVWLLTGEGQPWFSDVPERTSAMAGNLLELVEAMNAVAHMRLGALAGKHHLRVLRELNEALLRFEELRARLNENAAPVLLRLLQDIEKAMAATDVDRATDLHKAISQVRRFVDDSGLEYRIEAVNATFELMRRNPYDALKHQQRMFRLSMGEGLLGTQQELNETIRLAYLLAESGREADALGLCLAAMELAGEQGRRWDSFPFLAFFTGQLMVNNLRLYEGIELMQRWLPHIKGAPRLSAARHMLPFAMVYAGLIRPEEAFDVGGDSEVKALNLLFYAIFRQEPDYLREALRHIDLRKGPRKDLEPMGYVPEYGALLLEVLEGKGSDHEGRFKHVRRYLDDDPRATTAQDMLVFETQLLRLLKRKARARKTLRAAEEAITSPPRPARTLLMTRAIHHRNALEIEDAELQVPAREFFEAHLKAGYRALHPGSALTPDEPAPPTPARATRRPRGRRG